MKLTHSELLLGYDTLTMSTNAFLVSDDADAWARVGAAIAQRRNELDFSQRDAAEISGVGINSFNEIEQGKRPRIRRLTVMKLERFLGWAPRSIDALLIDGIQPEAAQDTTDSTSTLMLQQTVVELQKRLDELEARINKVLK